MVKQLTQEDEIMVTDHETVKRAKSSVLTAVC
jgi:hypothetical protein